jgi:hypothetical protein
MFGRQFNVPITTPFPLKDVTLISAPSGWTGSLSSEAIHWATSLTIPLSILARADHVIE